MLKLNPVVLAEIAAENGWLHTSGRLAGTVNATQMAEGLGVSVTTITRAYENGATGLVLLERLKDTSGRPLDDLVRKVAA